MHAFRTTCILGAALLASACTTLPKDASMDTGQFLPRTLVVDGTPHNYQVFVPSPAAGGKHPPIILFLHGTGERGSDGEKPTKVGLGPYVRQHMADFPAIVVFAQAPDDRDWMGATAQLAIDELDAASREFHADSKRTYLTGLSMGGYGTWEVALMQPQRFAALVPICGALTPPSDERSLFVTPLAGAADPYAAVAQALRDVPIWIFHGAKDDLVPLDDDRKTYAALKAAGADARYTEFPDANHNAWDPAYSQTPELWTWLFAQKRP